MGVLSAWAATAACAEVPVYKVSGAIAGTNSAGWDYAAVNSESDRLYVARTDGVMAVALTTRTITENLVSAQKAHAVLPIPGMGPLLQTDGVTGTARLIDEKTGTMRWSVETGSKPDGALWDAAQKRAIIINNGSGTIAIVNVSTGKVTGTVKLASGLGMAALDKRNMLWVNNEDTNTFTPVNMKSLKAEAPVALTGCEGPAGLVYAPKQDALIAACGNGVAVAVDAAKRSIIAHFAIGKHADYALIDAARGFAAIPCGEGVLEFFDPSGATLRHAATLKTEPGARTGALDPRTGVIYLPAVQFSPPEKAGGRPKIIPGSFHILIVSPSAAG